MSTFGDINRIGTNISALNSLQALNRVNVQIQNNQLQLSTGKRINSASDDASGYAIAKKIDSRLSAMSQAMLNVGDARSILDIAEGGMNAVSDVLTQIKSKLVQGANGNLGETERGFIRDQIAALITEVDDIADSTTYQGIGLLGGYNATFQTGEASSNTLSVALTEISAAELLDAGLVDGAGDPATFLSLLDAADESTFNALLNQIDAAIDTLSSEFNKIGVVQVQLSAREENLSQSIIANSAAKSRIEDADFAKLQSEAIRLSILQQTTTNAFTVANTSPQAVLGFLN